MKTLFKAVAAAVVLAAPSLALATTWEIDPGHATAQFSVHHRTMSNVQGTFGKLTGTVELDDKDITRSSVTAIIDATSFATPSAARDSYLRSSDFFRARKHPTMTFRSKKVEKAGDGKLLVTGDLTLQGVTREVVLDVELQAGERKDRGGLLRRGLSARTLIKRKDFGLTWNKMVESGGLISNEVAVTLEVELIRTPADAAPGKATP